VEYKQYENNMFTFNFTSLRVEAKSGTVLVAPFLSVN
jgi:hypothetical protein